MMLTADSVRERRLAYREVVRRLVPLIKDKTAKVRGDNQKLESLERLQSLERLERLQSLERLESLQSLTYSVGDYRDVEIPDGSVIYADIPYRTSTQKDDYGVRFDHEAFYDWCEAQTQPLFILSAVKPTGL